LLQACKPPATNDGAALSAAGGFADTGCITVIAFQWPATTTVGAAWQATPELLVAADVKQLAWAEVMKDFKLRHDCAGIGGSVNFAPASEFNGSVSIAPKATVTNGDGVVITHKQTDFQLMYMYRF
jgi:hypothetical protein